ncbi:MAG: hypothetical protein DHS20C11_05280 [Lysobacteraceae bacterium]|nr:MAG: hypothetical protein DHS20C11_05280 [Xanthomonadaceae bacterium]
MDTLRENGEEAESELEGVTNVSAETSRRLSCDCGVVHSTSVRSWVLSHFVPSETEIDHGDTAGSFRGNLKLERVFGAVAVLEV